MNLQELKQLYNTSDRGIYLQPTAVDLCGGNIKAALALTQLLNWFFYTNSTEIYKSDQELCDECYFKIDNFKRQIKPALKQLNFLKIELKNTPPTTYYFLDIKALEKSLKSLSAQKCRKYTIKSVENTQLNVYKIHNQKCRKYTIKSVENTQSYLYAKNNNKNNNKKYARESALGVKPKSERLNQNFLSDQTSFKNDSDLSAKESAQTANACLNDKTPAKKRKSIYGLARGIKRAITENEQNEQPAEVKLPQPLKEKKPQTTQTRRLLQASDKPANISDNLWSEYCEFRKARKQYYCEVSIKAHCEKIANFGELGEQSLKNSISNNWVGVFLPSPPKSPPQQSSSPFFSGSGLSEQTQRAFAEFLANETPKPPDKSEYIEFLEQEN
nr:MAG TPA: hypothetical protein [Caudoviricetes sp.]